MNLENVSLPRSPLDDLLRVVLVEPEHNLNIGSVARAMSNFGFSHLHLVAPKDLRHAEAHITACWAASLINQAPVHATLESAVADVESVIGFSSYEGDRYFGQRLFPDWLETFRRTPTRKTALLFGTEDHGLCREHLERCEYVVRIPTAAENPSLNLAHAVLVVMYELSKIEHTSQLIPSENLATEGDLSLLDRLLTETSVRLKLSRTDQSNPTPGRLRNMLRRIAPTRVEARLLTTLFSRMLKNISCTDGKKDSP